MPRPISKGAQTAAGVPAPAQPSRNAPKPNATITICLRESSVRLITSSLILSIAPVSRSMLRIQKADMIM